MAFTHPACEKQWTGLRKQHCTACCETFSSTSAGDAHVDRRCLPPADAGLVSVDTEVGMYWKMPGDYRPAEREDDTP